MLADGVSNKRSHWATGGNQDGKNGLRQRAKREQLLACLFVFYWIEAIVFQGQEGES